ncbi:MAG TPA: RCC1 domain-containing protein [Miltoncostaeaceae bacterium]|nr:RCC1 domain-containing protein [Miltoncostaeaceae bacterium]
MWGLLGALIACLMVTAAQAGAEVVSAGGGHSCAVRAGGTVACWGANS